MRKSQAPSSRSRGTSVVPKETTNFLSKSKGGLCRVKPTDLAPRSAENILELLSSNTPIQPVNEPAATSPSQFSTAPQCRENIPPEVQNPESSTTRYLSIVFGKHSTKKHKSWEGDGVLFLNDRSCVAKNDRGNNIGSTRLAKDKVLESGTRLFIGDKEVEIVDEISASEAAGLITVPEPSKKIALEDPAHVNKPVSHFVKADKAVSCNSVGLTAENQSHTPTDHQEACLIYTIVYAKPSTRKHKKWEGDGTLHVGDKTCTAKDEKGKILGSKKLSDCKAIEEGAQLMIGGKEVELVEKISADELAKRTNEMSAVTAAPPPVVKKFKPLLIKKFTSPQLGAGTVVIQGNDGLKLPDPSAEQQWSLTGSGASVTPVTVEPFLARLLRPHQRKGVIFMYECVMGYRGNGVSGAILADEMGLGKTLQCIALIWTLLRQGPYGKPGARSVLVVTPSSLTGNWAAEFRKWLGDTRLRPQVVDAKNKPGSSMVRQPVVIVSYEMLLRHTQSIGDGFDLLICDEAHRLKNADTKVSQALNELCIPMRILLTGTPIQNDLQEFYALADFTNPNCLGAPAHFRRQFEEPILAARQPHASDEVREIGEERATELNELTSAFVLRRTQAVLDSYLPGKREVVVFCKPSLVQRDVYNSVLDGLEMSALGFEGSSHLAVISALRKVANHPALLIKQDDDPESTEELVGGSIYNHDEASIEDSGKLTVVARLLDELSAQNPRERIVIVSAFTQTLDMIQEVCQLQNYPTLRLDGTTASGQRTDIVSRFNQDSSQFVFLLSAKAGGVGLNLIGASRLVLFDSDWNPATDLQAMARIWRDGQKRHVYIYRLLTAGTIEEKIFQRQLSKQTLAGGIVDCLSANSVLLSRDELKDIFLPCEDIEDCWTHSSLGCECGGVGGVPASLAAKDKSRPCQVQQPGSAQQSALRMEELMGWEHHGRPFADETLDLLKLSTSRDIVSFMFSTSC